MPVVCPALFCRLKQLLPAPHWALEVHGPAAQWLCTQKFPVPQSAFALHAWQMTAVFKEPVLPPPVPASGVDDPPPLSPSHP